MIEDYRRFQWVKMSYDITYDLIGIAPSSTGVSNK